MVSNALFFGSIWDLRGMAITVPILTNILDMTTWVISEKLQIFPMCFFLNIYQITLFFVVRIWYVSPKGSYVKNLVPKCELRGHEGTNCIRGLIPWWVYMEWNVRERPTCCTTLKGICCCLPVFLGWFSSSCCPRGEQIEKLFIGWRFQLQILHKFLLPMFIAIEINRKEFHLIGARIFRDEYYCLQWYKKVWESYTDSHSIWEARSEL